MSAIQSIPVQQNKSIVLFLPEDRTMSVKLFFSQKPSHEAPEMISALLRKSYLNRITSESRRFE